MTSHLFVLLFLLSPVDIAKRLSIRLSHERGESYTQIIITKPINTIFFSWRDRSPSFLFCLREECNKWPQRPTYQWVDQSSHSWQPEIYLRLDFGPIYIRTIFLQHLIYFCSERSLSLLILFQNLKYGKLRRSTASCFLRNEQRTKNKQRPKINTEPKINREPKKKNQKSPRNQIQSIKKRRTKNR